MLCYSICKSPCDRAQTSSLALLFLIFCSSMVLSCLFSLSLLPLKKLGFFLLGNQSLPTAGFRHLILSVGELHQTVLLLTHPHQPRGCQSPWEECGPWGGLWSTPTWPTALSKLTLMRFSLFPISWSWSNFLLESSWSFSSTWKDDESTDLLLMWSPRPLGKRY